MSEAAAYYDDQRAQDNEPCPVCGGDRLRTDFTASGRCHVSGSTVSQPINSSKEGKTNAGIAHG